MVVHSPNCSREQSVRARARLGHAVRVVAGTLQFSQPCGIMYSASNHKAYIHTVIAGYFQGVYIFYEFHEGK